MRFLNCSGCPFTDYAGNTSIGKTVKFDTCKEWFLTLGSTASGEVYSKLRSAAPRTRLCAPRCSVPPARLPAVRPARLGAPPLLHLARRSSFLPPPPPPPPPSRRGYTDTAGRRHAGGRSAHHRGGPEPPALRPPSPASPPGSCITPRAPGGAGEGRLSAGHWQRRRGGGGPGAAAASALLGSARLCSARRCAVRCGCSSGGGPHLRAAPRPPARSPNVPMATKIDKEACREAYNLVRDDATEVNWVTFKYNGSTIVPGDQGVDYETFKRKCTDDVRLFGFVRFTTGDAMSKRVKFALITWIGEDVSGLQRAKTGTDKTLVKEVVQNFAKEFVISDHKELDEDYIKNELKKAGGANYDAQTE